VFRQNGIDVASQVKFKVEFRGETLGEFIADIVVENKVIIELKAVSQLATEHSAQVINYLKASGLETGLLVNFGRPRLEIRHLYNPRLQRNEQDKRVQG
jgi:GxxExxY protein